jgi:hypothetical protein
MRVDVRELSVLVLAAGVAIAVIALAVGAAVHTNSISISEAALLGTVLGTAVGGLVALLSFRAGANTNISNNNANQPWPTPPAPPGPPSVRPQ